MIAGNSTLKGSLYITRLLGSVNKLSLFGLNKIFIVSEKVKSYTHTVFCVFEPVKTFEWHVEDFVYVQFQ